MRPVIEKHLKIEARYKLIMDSIGDECVTAKEIMKRSGLTRDAVYYILAHLSQQNHLIITRKITKKGQGMLNYYAFSGLEFIPNTVEQLEKLYPPGYFSKLRNDQRPAQSLNEKGPYDDMIAANPNLRKISAMFETRPELFKQKSRKTEHRGIPSTFGMYNSVPSGLI
jgi:hypothetical protein